MFFKIFDIFKSIKVIYRIYVYLRVFGIRSLEERIYKIIV